MQKLEFYDGSKTYMAPSGTLYNKERLLQDFPSALDFAHLIHTDDGGEVCYGVYNYKSYCACNDVPYTGVIADDINALEAKLNVPPPEPEPDAQERAVANAEFESMMNLPDEDRSAE
jgi:hypothetical protein